MATQLKNNVWGKIANINELSDFDEMLRVTRQTGRQQLFYAVNTCICTCLSDDP